MSKGLIVAQATEYHSREVVSFCNILASIWRTDLETAIMHKLQNAILEKSEVLFTVMQCAAELDWSV